MSKQESASAKPNQWLAEKAVSEIIGLSTSTLQKHRHRNMGIPFSKIGGCVRYKLEDVEAFMAAHRIVPGGSRKRSNQKGA